MTLLSLSPQVGYFECKSIRTKAHALLGITEKPIERNATQNLFLFESTQASPIKIIAISSCTTEGSYQRIAIRDFVPLFPSKSY